jgi:hypothetical protein
LFAYCQIENALQGQPATTVSGFEPGFQVGEVRPCERYSEFDKCAHHVAKIGQVKVAVSCWAKVVALIVIAIIAFVLIAPDIDLHPTVSRASRAVQKPSNAVFHSVVPAAVMTALSISALPAQSLALRGGDSSANLIDLKCSRLC